MVILITVCKYLLSNMISRHRQVGSTYSENLPVSWVVATGLLLSKSYEWIHYRNSDLVNARLSVISLDGPIKPGTWAFWISETAIFKFHYYPWKFAVHFYLFVHKGCPSNKWRFAFVMCHAFRQFLFHVVACHVPLWRFCVYEGCSWKHLDESGLVITAVQRIQTVLITDAQNLSPEFFHSKSLPE